MICLRCGSTQFEEENGLFYCLFCHTQSQGFTQESDDTFADRSKFFAKEIKTSKRKTKVVAKPETGVLWTTTEAFSIILFTQINKIYENNSKELDLNVLKDLTSLIWCTYLSKSSLSFTDDECHNKEPVHRLHPATRFRDQQILIHKVDNHLPPYKNGSSKLGFINVFKLGSDGVIRTVEELETLEDFDWRRSKDETNYELYDVFYDRYRDPRSHSCRSKSYELRVSKESRKQLRGILSQLDLQTSFEKTIDLLNTNETNIETNEERSEDLKDSPINTDLVNSNENSFKNEDNFDDFDRELMSNSTESTKLFSKYIPLSYLKSSQNVSSDYFIDLMSLPKTLAILNIVFRLLCCDIYLFDLIRWVIEGHIPYNNCLTCLPNDWLFISNDFHTFTSCCIPSSKTISTLSAKIMKFNRMNSIPRPDLEVLLIRFTKDLNLPKDLVSIIQQNYNLFEHFPNKLERMAINCRKMKSFPLYERWALMAILIVLKRIFVLNDSTEIRLSRSANNVNYLFIWEEWEKYTRLRLELIRSYFIPIYSGNPEDIRDVELIANQFLKRSEYETKTTINSKRKAEYKYYEFRTTSRSIFSEYLLNKNQFNPSEELKSSLYPLTNATDFVLKRINSSSMTDLLSISFEHKLMSPWICSHGKTFHRGYEFLHKDINQWSSSFTLLMELSSIVLHSKYENLIKILNQMEKRFFGLNAE